MASHEIRSMMTHQILCYEYPGYPPRQVSEGKHFFLLLNDLGRGI